MSEAVIPVHAIKGRGTATRVAHRFEKDSRVAYDDGWGTLGEAVDGELPKLETEIIFEQARSAITVNDSPDIFFDYGLNPYRGCEHVILDGLLCD